jgi:uncharacterized protein YggE
MKLLSIAVLAMALATAVAFAGVGRPGAAHGSPAPSGRTITVNGTGTARGAPDSALFTFGVETRGATAKATLAANSARMQSVIAALQREGVAKADLRTEDVSVYPHETDSGTPDGFSASSTVSTTVRKLSTAGSVLDAAVAAGANETSGPEFDSSSKAGLTRLALRDAFADARDKAEALADEAGVHLGDVRRIDATEADYEPGPMMLTAEKATHTPVEPGIQHAQASVTVTFSLS